MKQAKRDIWRSSANIDETPTSSSSEARQDLKHRLPSSPHLTRPRKYCL